ncbi:hypothetical protein TrispH2_001082 [Trichoplax sp. H2]|nr:hypothetical protein TrispH2_001082 [Trichoplax sp. H2]|eukprot:RDD46742.1 hypothetical protein TrispH2_001082 [Trichoplax sp. H2]
MNSTDNFELKEDNSKYLETTLPSLLTLYGVEDYQKLKSNKNTKTVVREKSTKKARSKKKSASRNFDFDPEPEELCDHLEKMSILRDHYRRVYMEALEEKIDEQRQNIKEMQMKALKKQERHKQHLLKDKRRILEDNRMKRSKPVSDSSFTDALPKTAYYKIIGLERRFVKEGKIKGHSQINTFWNGMLSQPKQLQKALGGELAEDDIKNLLMDRRIKTTSKIFDYITVVNESDGLGDLPTHEQMLQALPELTGIRSRDSKRASRRASRRGSTQQGYSIEKMFPRVSMPTMESLQKSYVIKGPSPEEIQRKEEERLKLRIRQKARRRIGRMYLHALANESASARKIEDSVDALRLSCRISDFITATDQVSNTEQDESDEESVADNSQTRIPVENNSKDSDSKDQLSQDEITKEAYSNETESNDDKLLFHDPIKTLIRKEISETKMEKRQNSNANQLEPLSMSQLMRESHTKEAKRLSSLWKIDFLTN